MKYGICYKGSKNKLAEKIVELFPSTTNFYDLFCGGYAITHRALVENRWKNYVINDLFGGMPQLFLDAIHGKFRNETRWISREDFFNTNETYVKVCWSFGNNCRDYLYSKEIEPYKKAWHEAIFFNKFIPLYELTGIDLRDIADIKDLHEKYLKSKELIRNKADQQLQRLQNLERLENTDRITMFNKSYDEIEIKPDSVIYCDIPYENTNAYGKKNIQSFDFEKFYSWCSKQKELTFISSYQMPEDRFYCVEIFSHRSTLSASANNAVTEKLYIPKHQIDLYNSKKYTLF